MILAHPFSLILGTYLVSKSFGNWPQTKPAWNVGLNSLPDDTDANVGLPYVSIWDRKADQNSVNMQTGHRSEFVGWQILVRGMKDTDASFQIKQIAEDLDALYQWPVSIVATTYVIQRVRRTSQPLFMKQQERSNMRIWTMEGYASTYYQGT